MSIHEGRDDVIDLTGAGASARVALQGAEPVSWRVGGKELIWHGDPAHWPRHAPILFPVVGASAGDVVRVGPQACPMPRHGFARDAPFTLVAQSGDAARLRLTESDETWKHYPFRFRLEVAITLGEDSLSLAFEVTNTDARDIPFGLGFHPAFPWPFDGGSPDDYTITFEAQERSEIPTVTETGLLRLDDRRMPLRGRTLSLDPELFAGDALIVLNARSRSLRFKAPSGAALAMAVEDFPHVALWTKPGAPFLSLEAWTGHADLEGFSGQLSERASIRRLAVGQSSRHAVTLGWHPA